MDMGEYYMSRYWATLGNPYWLLTCRPNASIFPPPHYPGRVYEVDDLGEINRVPTLTPWGHPDPLAEVDWP